MTNLRRAKTLVEVMVIITILSVVLAASTTTLAALLKLERQFRRDAEQSTMLARLGAQFRGDVHQAKDAAVGEDCVLTWPDGRAVRYAAGDREITREVRRGDAVEHRDSFRLPAPAAVNLAKVEQPGGSLVRLTIRPSGPPATGSPPIATTTIDAALALQQKEALP